MSAIDGQTLQSVLDGFQVTGEDGTRAFPAAAPGDRVIDVAQAAGLFHTASEARRAIKSGGVYLNNMRVEDGDAVLTDADFLQGRFALIRRGKKALGAVEHRGHYGNGNGRGNGHYGKGRGPSRPGRGGKPGYGHEGRGGKGGFRKDFRKSDGFRAEGAGEGGEERRDSHKGPRRDFQRGGYDSLAVLTGVTNPRELMLAPAHLRPTYVARDLRALPEPARRWRNGIPGSPRCPHATTRARPRSCATCSTACAANSTRSRHERRFLRRP